MGRNLPAAIKSIQINFLMLVGVFAFVNLNQIKDVSAMSVTLVGAAALPGISLPIADYPTSRLQAVYGGGILLGFNMFSTVSIESGYLYMPRGFNLSYTDGNTYSFSMTTVQAPLILRVAIVPAFTVGAGAYFAYGIGGLSGTNATSGGSSIPFTATANPIDYGYVLSISIKLDFFPAFGIVIDGRYVYSLANNIAINTVSTGLNDFQVLAGFRFGK